MNEIKTNLEEARQIVKESRINILDFTSKKIAITEDIEDIKMQYLEKIMAMPDLKNQITRDLQMYKFLNEDLKYIELKTEMDALQKQIDTNKMLIETAKMQFQEYKVLGLIEASNE